MLSNIARVRTTNSNANRARSCKMTLLKSGCAVLLARDVQLSCPASKQIGRYCEGWQHRLLRAPMMGTLSTRLHVQVLQQDLLRRIHRVRLQRHRRDERGGDRQLDQRHSKFLWHPRSSSASATAATAPRQLLPRRVVAVQRHHGVTSAHPQGWQAAVAQHDGE